MTITQQEIEKIADLAQIAVTPVQCERLHDDLNNIIKLVDKLNELDVSAIEPLAHSLDSTQPLRDDRVTETNQRELFQSIAPQVQFGLYIVPKVLEAE